MQILTKIFGFGGHLGFKMAAGTIWNGYHNVGHQITNKYTNFHPNPSYFGFLRIFLCIFLAFPEIQNGRHAMKMASDEKVVGYAKVQYDAGHLLVKFR